MIGRSDGRLKWYAYESFPDDRVIQGAFTRMGGVSAKPFASLNVGSSVGDDADYVAANHEAIYRALEMEAGSVVSAQQMHGDNVVVVSPENRGKTLPGTDALISAVPGIVLLLRFADCVPISLYAPREGVLGLAHAGWRGTVSNIVGKTVRAMVSTFGCEPEGILAGLGPSIGPCCYQVGEEVMRRARRSLPSAETFFSNHDAQGRAYLDLWRANDVLLREAGVIHVESAELCTCCHQHEFFSHRGEAGRTGRFAVLLGLRSREP